MKRIATLALIAGAAAAAQAQSSVTVYGFLDLGIVKGNGGTAANPFALGASEAWQLRERSSSRLGFRGNEDIGGGWSTQFQIEHRFSPDTGTITNPTFWHGRTYLQLSPPGAGKIYAGREYSPAYWPAYFTDPAGWDGVGTLGTHQYAGFRSTSGIRTNNTVGYRSPEFGGLTINAAVSLGEGAAGRDSAINAQYRSGPIYVGAGFEKISGGPAATDGDSLANLGISYDFGFVKPMVYLARGKTGGGQLSNRAATVAATVPAGLGQAYVAYGRYDPNGANNNQTKLGAGYYHPLSKRTNLYAGVGQGREDGRTNNTAYEFGMKHLF